jgi:site-specific recombinase XerD
MDHGIVVPSRWSTGTNDPLKANAWALLNRERLLSNYYRQLKEPKIKSMCSILKNYYKPNSEYLLTERNRGRKISDHTAGSYYNFINKKFIPCLRRYGIQDFSGITPPFIAKFQNSLLKNIKPQTVNYFIGCIKSMFDYLVLTGRIQDNVFSKVLPLRVPEEDKGNTGCYHIDQLKGIFNKRWENKKLFLLNLIIYTTNLRNSEIERLKLSDIEKLNTIRFLNVKVSKSCNGKRMIPLHPFVYKKIIQYAKDVKPDDFILSNGKPNQSTLYKRACITMGQMLGKTEDYLNKEQISFYSGRTWWKTAMNAAGLGEVEEYFMGHKVSSDIAKRYNHKDKQGAAMLTKKAREMFAVLDKYLFRVPKKKP